MELNGQLSRLLWRLKAPILGDANARANEIESYRTRARTVDRTVDDGF